MFPRKKLVAAEIVPLGVSEFPLPLRSTREAIETPLEVVSCEASNQSVHPGIDFGVKTLKIFGNDFLKVYKAIEYAFNYNGPVFIEANTYRISSHVGPEDDSKYYRDKKEIENWKKKCPIKNVEKYTKLSKKDINNIKKEVSEAFKYARKSKFYFIKNWEIENVSTDKKNYNSQNVLDHSYSTKDTMPEPY